MNRVIAKIVKIVGNGVRGKRSGIGMIGNEMLQKRSTRMTMMMIRPKVTVKIGRREREERNTNPSIASIEKTRKEAVKMMMEAMTKNTN